MRYFFHINDGRSAPDAEGTELSSFDEAKEQAVALAGQCIKDLAQSFWKAPEWSMIVANIDGLTLLSLDFSGVIAALPAPPSFTSPRDS